MTTETVLGRKSGTLANATPVIIPVNSLALPMTAVVRSTTGAATLNIELSADGGVEFFTSTFDYSSTTEKVIAITTPITHIRVTGVSAAIWALI